MKTYHPPNLPQGRKSPLEGRLREVNKKIFGYYWESNVTNPVSKYHSDAS